MVHGALEAAAELGWMVVLVNTGVDRAFEADQIRALQSPRSTTICASACQPGGQPLCWLPDHAAVLVDAACSNPGIASVVPDEYAGGVAAAHVLLGHGHPRIGSVNNLEDITASRDRLRGFQVALADSGRDDA